MKDTKDTKRYYYRNSTSLQLLFMEVIKVVGNRIFKFQAGGNMRVFLMKEWSTNKFGSSG